MQWSDGANLGLLCLQLFCLLTLDEVWVPDRYCLRLPDEWMLKHLRPAIWHNIMPLTRRIVWLLTIALICLTAASDAFGKLPIPGAWSLLHPLPNLGLW